MTPPEEPAKKRGLPGAVKVGLVFVVLVGAAVWLLAFGSDSPFTYSKLVHEVMSEPDSFEGRRLRVEG